MCELGFVDNSAARDLESMTPSVAVLAVQSIRRVLQQRNCSFTVVASLLTPTSPAGTPTGTLEVWTRFCPL